MNQIAFENFKIDKSNWEKVKLGDVVFEPKETVKDPIKEGIQHVVGLEHIDSEDIHLRRSASINESTTFTKKFRKGDVLFGRRRAYLKKAAVADFDGICSGDITVMRAKEGLLPELLPFVINNDKFFDYAVTHSAGGLSPRVKFENLSKYEFLLPPKEYQSLLTQLLWTADGYVQTNNQLNSSFINIEKTLTKNIFLSGSGTNLVETPIGLIPRNWKCLKLEELINDGSIISHLDGNHGSFYPKNNEFVNEGVPYISANCIDGDSISFLNAKYLTEDRASKIKKGVSYNGDILLAHNATVGPVCILSTDKPKVILSTTLTHYRVNPQKLDREYVFYFMRSRLFQSQLEKVMSQSTRDQVPITTQRNFYFIIPPIDIQKEIVGNLLNVVETKKLVSELIVSSSRVLTSLINKIF